MLMKKATFESPELVFIAVRNVAATTAVPGDSAQFNPTADVMGLDVHTANSGEEECYAGIWSETVARSKHGLMQVYGYSTKIKLGLSSSAIGDFHKLLDNKSYVVPIIAGKSLAGQAGDQDSHLGFVISWSVTSLADSVGTTGPFNGFIRAL